MRVVDAHQTDDVAAVRAQLFDGLAPLQVFAKAIGRELRTVQRMIAKKELPFVQIAGTRYVQVDRAREMLMHNTAKEAA